MKGIVQAIKDYYKIDYQWKEDLGCIHRKCDLPISLCECEDVRIKPVLELPKEPKLEPKKD